MEVEEEEMCSGGRGRAHNAESSIEALRSEALGLGYELQRVFVHGARDIEQLALSARLRVRRQLVALDLQLFAQTLIVSQVAIDAVASA